MATSEATQPRCFPKSPNSLVGIGSVPQAGKQEAWALPTPWTTGTSVPGQWPGTQEAAGNAQHLYTLGFPASVPDPRPALGQTPCQPGLRDPVVT